ncbi:SIR2 family protein [Mucilaginibacter sp. UC70_90]
MDLPNYLIDQINQGNVVLFLGAGASFDAFHPKGKKIPSGQQLSDSLAEKFLSSEYKGKPLQYVSELSINESDLYTVQKYVYDEFIDFKPAEHHELIKTFKWAAIVTTNYDLLIEDVYTPSKKPLQSLIPFKRDGERIDEKLTVPNSLIYLKLHGCITEINTPQLPLILTPDQYVTHKTNRSRLFERVKDLSYEHPFIFVGYSLADLDIRSMLSHLDNAGDSRPRSFMVGPYITDLESKMWERKRITSIKSTFKDFLTTLDNSTDRGLRQLTMLKKTNAEFPVFDRFVDQSGTIRPTESLISFLTYDVTYLHGALAEEDSDPKDFYKGFFQNWNPIIHSYDVERHIKDTILSEVIIPEEQERRSNQDLYVIKGSAGSGKTVLLKRIAWDAAIIFNKLCIYLKPDVPIRYESIEELYVLCKERIFLFIDSPSDRIDDIRYVIKRAVQAKVLLTIVTAERINVWNTECSEIAKFLTQDYNLTYLNDKEIVRLIEKLDKYNSLGYLKDKSPIERISALSEIHGRELLVALHEATLGKPFEDIIFDEYNSINSTEAQSLYLTISILHRLGAQTRAGLVSRTHNISFTDFEQSLFLPLESIVFTRRNYTINDYIYMTRHQHIAEIVFERVLVNVNSRYDEYIRIISCLDVDYESDRHAFTSMTNARKLLEIFKNPELIRNIYRTASLRTPDNPKLLQQEAIFEMLSTGGSIDTAERLLHQAYELAPKDYVIAHSLAEMYYKKMERVKQPLFKERYLQESRKISQHIVKKGSDASHAYHTLIKINLYQLTELSENFDVPALERLIKDTEKLITEAKIFNPDQSFLLAVESKFNEILEDNPKALNALLKAFEINKRSTFICLRLVNFYEKRGQLSEAVKILKEAIEINQNDKDLNFKYAILLIESASPNLNDAKYFFRKAFTQGDTRYEPQYHYARCLYILNDIPGAKSIFDTLKDAKMDISIKSEPRFVIKDDGKIKIYQGSITKIEANYGFIKRDDTSDPIFIYGHKENKGVWDQLRKYQRVKFSIAFNYRGAVGIDLILSS